VLATQVTFYLLTRLINSKNRIMSVHLSREDKRASIARALAKEGFRDVYVLDHESAREVLTEKRLALLDYLRGHEVESVRGLAEAIERDKASVSRDLKTLAAHDLVEFRDAGARKVPAVKHETVVVEPVV
jgi:predicted transcriptional regulator